MDEQKRFMVVMCSKLVSNQLLRSPETERAEGRAAPFISPSPRSLGGCRVPTHCPKAVSPGGFERSQRCVDPREGDTLMPSLQKDP